MILSYLNIQYCTAGSIVNVNGALECQGMCVSNTSQKQRNVYYLYALCLEF